MSASSYSFRNMLSQYDRQLSNARRLAKQLEKSRGVGLFAHGGLQDFTQNQETLSDAMSHAERRRWFMVEHVSRELLENLLFAGSDNPIVEEVRQALDANMGGKHSYQYPPGSTNLLIIREDGEQRRELSPEQTSEVLDKLWAITLAKVDATML